MRTGTSPRFQLGIELAFGEPEKRGVSVGVRDEISGDESIVHEGVVIGKPTASENGG